MHSMKWVFGFSLHWGLGTYAIYLNVYMLYASKCNDQLELISRLQIYGILARNTGILLRKFSHWHGQTQHLNVPYIVCASVCRCMCLCSPCRAYEHIVFVSLAYIRFLAFYSNFEPFVQVHFRVANMFTCVQKSLFAFSLSLSPSLFLSFSLLIYIYFHLATINLGHCCEYLHGPSMKLIMIWPPHTQIAISNIVLNGHNKINALCCSLAKTHNNCHSCVDFNFNLPLACSIIIDACWYFSIYCSFIS